MSKDKLIACLDESGSKNAWETPLVVCAVVGSETNQSKLDIKIKYFLTCWEKVLGTSKLTIHWRDIVKRINGWNKLTNKKFIDLKQDLSSLLINSDFDAATAEITTNAVAVVEKTINPKNHPGIKVSKSITEDSEGKTYNSKKVANRASVVAPTFKALDWVYEIAKKNNMPVDVRLEDGLMDNNALLLKFTHARFNHDSSFVNCVKKNSDLHTAYFDVADLIAGDIRAANCNEPCLLSEDVLKKVQSFPINNLYDVFAPKRNP